MYLSTPLLLSPSMPGEELFLYLAVSSAVVSAALIREEGKAQKPMNFISRALRGAEERAMSSPEAARRMTLWAIEISEFDIHYQLRTAVKGKILVDFIVEFTTAKEQGVEETPIWRVHTNGSSNKHAGGVGVVLHTPEGDKIECMIRLGFTTTNNEAEYEALVAGLDLATAAGAKSVVVYSDS
ncbi:uncharacterized protein LOC142620706 [Castanea sativa]|uniref:uncharacterized protein LOC142620706 n=1 Tax=Castanea sativa TaxID=21020 RepID=UPI003F6513F6